MYGSPDNSSEGKQFTAIKRIVYVSVWFRCGRYTRPAAGRRSRAARGTIGVARTVADADTPQLGQVPSSSMCLKSR